jgi:hypothetical protein
MKVLAFSDSLSLREFNDGKGIKGRSFDEDILLPFVCGVGIEISFFFSEFPFLMTSLSFFSLFDEECSLCLESLDLWDFERSYGYKMWD